MPNSTDVAIVGGGIIGCSIAYSLAKRGIKSVVFERESFACGASGATAGMFTPLWHVDHANEALFEMGMRSLDMIPRLAAELDEAGIDPLFRQCGLLKVAMNSEESDTLRHDLIWQAELGIGVRWMDASEVIERVPGINPGVRGGVFSPTEGHVTGQRMVESLVHAATRLGATFLEGVEVNGLMTEDGQRVTGVRTARGNHPAGHTVIAAGPWTGLTDGLMSERIPVRAVKGQRILLRKQGLLPEFIVHSFRGTSVPQPDGSMLVAATRHEGEFDRNITVDAITAILSNATHILPALSDAVFIGARAGVRPGSPDDVPIIGPVPGWNGVSVATGHDGCGVMLSPGTAELMSGYIDTGNSSALEPFSPARFSSPSTA
ncbi:MAG: glycine oxidase ThiO [Chloroflexi bacterium]|nr:glycine oxidase ThiO [Chloroflexota bacterium]